MSALQIEPLATSAEERLALLRAHYAMQMGGFISKCQEEGGRMIVSSNLTSAPMWNHTALLDASTAKDDDDTCIYFVDEGQDHFAGQGYEKFEQESWMIWEARPFEAATSANLSVRKVGSPQELELFRDVFYQAFRTTEPGYGRALEQQFRASAADLEAAHYLGFVDGTAVCALTLIRRESEIGVYNVATIPSARRKGYAAALLLSTLPESPDQARVFLQVEKGGAAEQLYTRLGFREIFTRTAVRKPLSGALNGGQIIRERAPLPTTLRSRLASTYPSVPWKTVLLAAWSILISKYTREEEVELSVIADANSGKRVRTKVSPNASVTAHLRQLHNLEWETACPSASGREAYALVFQNASRLTQPSTGAELELRILPGNEGMEIHAKARAFTKDALRRTVGHFLTVLQGVAEQPNAPLGAVEILTAAERHQLLLEWSGCASDLGTSGLVHVVFEAQVESTPEASALRALGSDQSALSYRQLNRKANKLAHFLIRSGLKPGEIAGLCLNRSSNYVVALLAVWKAGATCLPLDPEYPNDRLAFMIEDAGVRLVITEQAFANRCHEMQVRTIPIDSEWDRVTGESDKNPITQTPRDRIAYVIYTSGSTGKPKGVLIPHGSFADHCQDVQKFYGLNHHDLVLQFSSVNFDASLEQIVPALLAGATLLLRPAQVWTVREFGQILSEHGLTVVDIPTAYWHQAARELVQDPTLIGHHSLRLVIVGGEAMNTESLRLWQRTGLREVRLVNAYGPTETTITATAFDAQNFQPPPVLGGKIPIGRPRGNRLVYVLDPAGNPVPIGIPGEIHIGGGCLATGYLNRPELTSARFVPNPFMDHPGARLYKTGDLGRFLEDSNLEFLGRLDDQVKIRGYRIELGEIENVLLQHRAIESAAVLAREEETGEKKLVAYCVLNDSNTSVRELMLHLRSKLADYMLPAGIVVLKELPLTPSGKLDRRALPNAPVEELVEGGVFKGPCEPMELRLQLVFERVLNKVPIAVNANFFELGGDSLQALELIVEIEKVTGKSLPLGTLYQSPTIEALAQVIHQQNSDAEWSALVPLQTRGCKPPLFLVHTTPGDVLGYGNMIYHLGLDQPCYGFQSLALKEQGIGHDSIEEMASYYVELLREIQPRGPYLLGGWCYGGMIAVEMARLLQAAGDTVPLLALLETVAMPPSWRNWRYFRHRLACSFRMPPKRWALYFREKIKYHRDSRMASRMRFKQACSDSDGAVNPAQEARMKHLEEVYVRNLDALKKYRSRPFPGKVTLFNASEQDPALIPDAQYGWVGLAREIEIHSVPGNHDTMLAEPHVRVLSQKLKDCIAKICATL